MKYLTPAIIRAQPAGLILQTNAYSVTDLDLVGWIDEAEQLIDAHMGFNERDSLGFSTGTHVEAQQWNSRTRRVTPSAFPVPVLSVSSFLIQYGQDSDSGAAQTATINPNSVTINNDDNYLEINTLATILTGIVPITAYAGVTPIVRVTYLAGYQVPKINRRLYPDSCNVYHSTIPFWDIAQPYNVYRNGSLLNPVTDYTLNPVDGSVNMKVRRPADVITASFIHQIPDQVSGALRKAMRDVPVADYYTNKLGLTGVSQQKTLSQSFTVSNTVTTSNGSSSNTGSSATWQQMLDSLTGPAIAS